MKTKNFVKRIQDLGFSNFSYDEKFNEFITNFFYKLSYTEIYKLLNFINEYYVTNCNMHWAIYTFVPNEYNMYNDFARLAIDGTKYIIINIRPYDSNLHLIVVESKKEEIERLLKLRIFS